MSQRKQHIQSNAKCDVGQINYVAGLALTDDAALYSSSGTLPIASCPVQVMSPYPVITLLPCVQTDNKLGYYLSFNSNKMTALCNAGPKGQTAQE